MSGPILSDFGPTERELLSAFVSRSVSQTWSKQRKTIEFLLYLSDAKPAVEFTRICDASILTTESEIPKEGFARLISAFDIPHKRVAKPLTDEFAAIYYECLPTEDTELPPQSEDEDTFHYKWGKHYGYPETAITAYINDNCLRYTSDSEDWNTLQQIADETGITNSQLRRLPLVSFRPPNTSSGLKEAVKRAEQYESTLIQIAETHRIPEIKTIVSNIVENTPHPTSE